MQIKDDISRVPTPLAPQKTATGQNAESTVGVVAAMGAVVRRFDDVASHGPQGRFAYPVGEAGLEALGYTPEETALLPPEARSRFCGIGNVLRAASPQPGEKVLDVGCGAGVDSLLAACQVAGLASTDRKGRESRAGALHQGQGMVLGVDLSPGMARFARKMALQWARQCSAAAPLPVAFVAGSATHLPLPDASVHCVLSNGVFSLIADKAAALAEIFRVLRPGGRLALADQIRGLAPLAAVRHHTPTAQGWAS